jgi:hypothetical protein
MRAPSPSEIADGSHLMALTRTLSHAGGGMGEGSLFSSSSDDRQVMGTPA